MKRSTGVGTIEQVRKAAGPGAEVGAAGDVGAPGIEIFWVVTTTKGGKRSGRAVAVVDGKLPWLEGEKAMEAVLAASGRDARVLAGAALRLLLNGRHARLIEKPEDHPSAPLPPAWAAELTPPTITGDQLEFWYFAGRAGTLRVRIDLSTWRRSKVVLQAVVQEKEDPIELARRWLSDTSQARNKQGIDRLVAACSDPRAPAALLDALTGEKRPYSRALAAEALAKCRHPAGVPALAKALGEDPDTEVRKAAIASLGVLGDAAARPALEKVARDDPDETLRAHAEWALGRLPKK